MCLNYIIAYKLQGYDPTDRQLAVYSCLDPSVPLELIYMRIRIYSLSQSLDGGWVCDFGSEEDQTLETHYCIQMYNRGQNSLTLR